MSRNDRQPPQHRVHTCCVPVIYICLLWQPRDGPLIMLGFVLPECDVLRSVSRAFSHSPPGEVIFLRRIVRQRDSEVCSASSHSFVI